jgi:hypothetical protein
MPPNPETGLVTLPEVVTGELAGKFGEISLVDRLQLELDVPVGYRMRDGYSAIACGLPTP